MGFSQVITVINLAENGKDYSKVYSTLSENEKKFVDSRIKKSKDKVKEVKNVK